MIFRRVILNVITTYLQTFISLVVGVFSTRWVYLALGEVGFGVFALVGSLIAFIGIFNSLMTSSNTRFFSIAIGEVRASSCGQENNNLQKWFNTAFSVHLVIAFALSTLMYPLGMILIKYKLNIPGELLESSKWIFKLSLIATFFGILNIPFHAIYTAKQLIFVRNLFGILQTLFFAIEAYWLYCYDGNKIIAHGLLSMLILTTFYVLMGLFAIVSFPECRIRYKYWFEKNKLFELLSYSSYSLIGSIGRLLSGPGMSIVLNIFLGPTINAVMGIGRQISSKIVMLPEAIISATSPEVMSRFGAEDIKNATSLALNVCYMSVVIGITVFVPLVIWLPDVLDLWLKSPPKWAFEISLLMILEAFFIKATSGYQILILATGRIKVYQIFLGLLNVSCAFVLWLLLKLDVPALKALTVAWLLPRSLISVGVIVFAKYLLALPVKLFFHRVFFPSVVLIFCSLFVSVQISSVFASFPIGGFFCAVGNAIVVLPLSYLMLSKEQRSTIRLYKRKKK